MITKIAIRIIVLCGVMAADMLAAEPIAKPGVETVAQPVEQPIALEPAANLQNSVALSFGSALHDDQLAVLRGGFVDGDGLRFAFAFDRVTRLNGEELSKVSVVMPVFNLLGGGIHESWVHTQNAVSLRGTSADGLASTIDEMSALSLFRMPLFIQNALDNQHIENLTLINLDISGTDALRGSVIQNLIETTSIMSLKP